MGRWPRAMGVQSDQELVQMVGTEPSMMLYLYPCIYACKKNNVYTQVSGRRNCHQSGQSPSTLKNFEKIRVVCNP